MNEISKCKNIIEGATRATLSCNSMYCAKQDDCNFSLIGVQSQKRVTIQMKATKQYFPVTLFIVLQKVVLTS